MAKEKIEVKTDGKTLWFPFSKLTGESLEKVEPFAIRKKSMSKIAASMIAPDISRIISSKRYDGVIPYLKAKLDTDDPDMELPTEALPPLIRECITPGVVETIVAYTKKIYKIDMDSKTSMRASKMNQEMQFTDRHAMIILQANMAARYVAPIVANYVARRGVADQVSFLATCFRVCYEPFEKIEGTNVLHKIFRFIESRVDATRYSDVVIWQYLSNRGTDQIVLTNSFFADIVGSILLKGEPDKNVVSFIDGVVRQKLKITFTAKFDIPVRSINMGAPVEETMTQLERFEMGAAKINEGVRIVMRMTSSSEVAKYKEWVEKNIKAPIPQKNIVRLMQNVRVSEFQKKIMALFLMGRWSSYDAIAGMNHQDYFTLLAALDAQLRWSGSFPNLQKLLVAKVDYLEKKPFNKKEIVGKFFDSEEFKRFVSRKMTMAPDILSHPETLFSLIGMAVFNKFVDISTGEEITVRPDDVAAEILRLASRKT